MSPARNEPVDGARLHHDDAGRDMREAHAHLTVTEREFDVVATEIKITLCQLNVPEREFDEFVAIIESYRPMVVHCQPVTA